MAQCGARPAGGDDVQLARAGKQHVRAQRISAVRQQRHGGERAA